MSLGAPEPLNAGHHIDTFDCGKSALNLWLVRHARQAQTSGSAKTFVASAEACIAGYYSLTVGQVDTMDAPDRVRQGMGQYPIPVVILARLAVSLTYQGKGIGLALLRDAIRGTLAIAEQAGIRVLLTHPIDDDAAHFCARFGSMPSPLREEQWLLLFEDAAE
jgi:GNAT superfamily N-acetyltransferase